MPGPAPQPQSRPAGALKIILKTLVTVALLAYVGSKLNWNELKAHVNQIEIGTYLIGSALMLLPILLTSVRWNLLLLSQEIHLPSRYVLGLGMSSQFFNAFLPGTTGGDALRAYHAFRIHPKEKTRIVTSLVFDRVLGVIAFCAIATGILLLVSDSLPPGLLPLHAFAEDVAVALVGIGIAGVLYFCWPGHIGLDRVRDWALSWSQRGILGKMLLFVISQRKYPVTFILALLATLLSCVFLFLSASFIARSMQLEMSLTTAALVMSVVAMTTAIPVSIGGHGVREVTLLTIFAPLGLVPAGDIESPVLFSLLLVSLQLLWGLLGGLWYLLILPRQTQKARAIAHAK